jgi:hypothetical protein
MNEVEPGAGVIVEQAPVPIWERDLLLARADRADLLVLPRTVRDGRGEYRAADLPAVKALRAADVSVDWAHPTSERTFASEFGAEVPVAIGLFIAQALGEESVVVVARWLLARVRQALAARPQRVEGSMFVVEVARLKVDGKRREIEGLRVTGSDERIVHAAASLLRGDPPPK